MKRTLTLVALVALVSGCGGEVLDHPAAPLGARAMAMKSASMKTGVPVEALAAAAYLSSRFEVSAAHEHDGHDAREGLMRLSPSQLQRAAELDGAQVDELVAAAVLIREQAGQGEHDWPTWLRATALVMVDGDESMSDELQAQLAAVVGDGLDLTTEDGERVVFGAVELPATMRRDDESVSQELTAPGQYPPLEWVPASGSNQMSGRGGGSVKYVLVHVTEGSYWSTISWFKQANPYSASTQYVIRSSDGHIAQMVSESNTAWHAGNDYYSRNSIGIEHEGFVASPSVWFTEAMYRSSSQLVCAIAKRYGIPVDHQHIIGHYQVPNSRVGVTAAPATDAQFAANKWAYGGVSNHFDPGTGWRWDYYLQLIRNCVNGGGGTDPEPPQPTLGPACQGSACWPRATLRRGDEGRDVFLLQQDLVYLGHLDGRTMLTGPGTFGPATEAALRAFQVTKTGVYDAASVTAMRAALIASPPSVPSADLAFGVTSSSVAALQRALTSAGYPVPDTGYFGPITQSAVLSFQNARGVPGADGSYGPLTRMALAAKLRFGR